MSSLKIFFCCYLESGPVWVIPICCRAVECVGGSKLQHWCQHSAVRVAGRGELHVVGTDEVKSVVLALVSGGTGWEKQMLLNVVPILACLQERARLKTVSVEGDTHIGRAVAAVVAPRTPIVTGLITQNAVFSEVQQQFLSEFAGLDPLSVLEYFRVRLMPVSQESFLDRLPLFRRVSVFYFWINVVLVVTVLEAWGGG